MCSARTVLEELLTRPGVSVVDARVRKNTGGAGHRYAPEGWKRTPYAPSFSHRLYLLIATRTNEARYAVLKEINKGAFAVAKKLPADFLDAEFEAFALKTSHVKVVLKSSEHRLLQDLLSRVKKRK